MACGAFLLALNMVQALTCTANHLEMRLLKISAEKSLKHLQGSAQISNLSSEMSALTEAKRKELGDNPSSEDYRQNMAEVESIENEYQTQINTVTNQMNVVETRLETQQEVAETRLEETNAEIDQWSELATSKAENNGYFENV